MRVTQSIKIGNLRINSMSSSSILQIGTSGAIRARSQEAKEQVTPAQAEQKLEGMITNSLQPLMEPQGLPVEPTTNVTQGTGTRRKKRT